MWSAGMTFLSLLLASGAVAQDHLLEWSRADTFLDSVRCVNNTHWERVSSVRGGNGVVSPCDDGFSCYHGACRGSSLDVHLQRSVFYQEVTGQDPSQLQHCSSDPMEDAKAGRLLCDVWHSTGMVKPLAGHELGNTWLSFQKNPSNPCYVNTTVWRKCLGEGMKAIGSHLRAQSAAMVFSGGLMEFLYRYNLDDPSQFNAACVPGSQGQWGSNDTCIPDIAESSAARDYYVQMGEAFLDGGVNLLFFGQARLTGGSEGHGSSGVAQKGAEGFRDVIGRLRDYAKNKGYGDVMFGPQAACCIKPSPSEELAEWVYGAQHLMPLANGGQAMLQPLRRQGALFLPPQKATPPWPWHYGTQDWHDANLVNNENAIPVVLDYDNYSGDESVPDDIRTLACTTQPQRSRILRDHFVHLRNYNPRASVSVPLSKVLGTNQSPDPFGMIKCWGGNHTNGLGGYFSAVACNITAAAKLLFSLPLNDTVPPPPTAPLSDLDPPITRQYFGQQLRSADAMVSWAYRSVLGRVADTGGYLGALASLPQIPNPSGSGSVAMTVDGALGARCNLFVEVAISAEFNATCNSGGPSGGLCSGKGLSCSSLTACVLYNGILLYQPSESEVNAEWKDVRSLADELCRKADSEGLYSPP